VAEGDYSTAKFAGAPNNSVVNFDANGDGRQNNFTFLAGIVIRCARSRMVQGTNVGQSGLRRREAPF